MSFVYYEPQFSEYLTVIPFGQPRPKHSAHTGAFIAPNGDLLCLKNSSTANVVFAMLHSEAYKQWSVGKPEAKAGVTAFRYKYPSTYVYLRVGYFFRVFCLSKPFTVEQSQIAVELDSLPKALKTKYRIGHSASTVRSATASEVKNLLGKPTVVNSVPTAVSTSTSTTTPEPKKDLGLQELLSVVKTVTGLTPDDLLKLSLAHNIEYPKQLADTLVKISNHVRPQVFEPPPEGAGQDVKIQ